MAMKRVLACFNLENFVRVNIENDSEVFLIAFKYRMLESECMKFKLF